MTSHSPAADSGLAPLYTRAFWTACLVHFMAGMSLSMFVLMPLFVRSLGGGEIVIGLLLGVGTAASVLARPTIGTLLDTRGRREVLLVAGTLNVVSWLPFVLIGSIGTWLFFWSIVHAIVWGALFAGFFTYAADLAPPSRRAEGIAVFGVFGMAPNGLGPWLGEVIIADAGFDAYFLTAAGFGLASTLLTLLIPRRKTTVAATETVKRGTWHDMREAVAQPGIPRVLVTFLLLGIAINAAFFFVAPFTRVLGMERAAPFFTAYAATSVVIRVFGRRILDVLGPHRVSIPAFALFALGLGALGQLPRDGVLVACGIACGAGHGTLFPVLSALAIARAPVRMQGTVVSLTTAALDLGAVVGTPVCGLVAQLLGYPAMFGGVAVASLAGLALMASDRTRPARAAA
jgi:MFS family permease